MYTDILNQAGLSEKEALIYEKMLETGPISAGKLLKQVPYKRGDVYYILSCLRNKGLASEELKGGLLIYSLTSPDKLEDLVKAEQEKTESARRIVKDALPNIRSLYNLSMQKPGVRFFEGAQGVKKVLDDSLLATSEILMYGDDEAIERLGRETNASYIKKRINRGIKKRMILFGVSSSAVNNSTLTETRFLKRSSDTLIPSIMYLYDAKISYITFQNNLLIGIIIEDPSVCSLHRALFESQWLALPPQPTPPLASSG